MRRRPTSSGRSRRSIMQLCPVGRSASVRAVLPVPPLDFGFFQPIERYTTSLVRVPVGHLRKGRRETYFDTETQVISAVISTSQGAMIGGVLRDHSQHSTTVPERETAGSYSRNDVLRLLKIDNRQLRTWERQQLVPELTHYRFSDLLLLKRIAKLRAEKANPRLIKEAQRAASKWLKEFPQLSDDVQVYKDGRHVRIQIGKQKLEPASGQLLLDFEEEEIKKLLQLPASQKSNGAIAEKLRQKIEADYWFERGLELEQK